MPEASGMPSSIALRVTALARQTPRAWLFTLGPAEGASLEGLTFAPGQVAILEAADGTSGYVAIASPPELRDALQFLVRGTGPIGERFFADGENLEVSMRGPVGRGFLVDEFEGKDLVFVAQGTAAGAIRSAILHTLARRERFGSITFIYGARTPDDFNFVDELDAWRGQGVKVELTCTQPGETWVGAQGRVQSLLATAVRDALAPVAFICGSLEMMDESTQLLREAGVPDERILRNY